MYNFDKITKLIIKTARIYIVKLVTNKAVLLRKDKQFILIMIKENHLIAKLSSGLCDPSGPSDKSDSVGGQTDACECPSANDHRGQPTGTWRGQSAVHMVRLAVRH